MASTTPKHALPYPQGSDDAVPHSDIQALAVKLDTELDAIAPGQIIGPTAGQLLIANASGKIVGIAISGDATISPAGELTVGNKKIKTAALDDKAVTTGKLDDGAVATDKISNNAITSAKVADGAITLNKTSFTLTQLAVNGTSGSEAVTGIPYTRHFFATPRLLSPTSAVPRVTIRIQGTQVWAEWANGPASEDFKIEILAI